MPVSGTSNMRGAGSLNFDDFLDEEELNNSQNEPEGLNNKQESSNASSSSGALEVKEPKGDGLFDDLLSEDEPSETTPLNRSESLEKESSGSSSSISSSSEGSLPSMLPEEWERLTSFVKSYLPAICQIITKKNDTYELNGTGFLVGSDLYQS